MAYSGYVSWVYSWVHPSKRHLCRDAQLIWEGKGLIGMVECSLVDTHAGNHWDETKRRSWENDGSVTYWDVYDCGDKPAKAPKKPKKPSRGLVDTLVSKDAKYDAIRTEKAKPRKRRTRDHVEQVPLVESWVEDAATKNDRRLGMVVPKAEHEDFCREVDEFAMREELDGYHAEF